jgi:urease accessory protein
MAPKRATTHIRRGDLAGRTARDTITLARADRYKRRVALTTDGGQAFLLDLAEATYLTHGDLLALDDGGLIEVRAAAEPLVQIHAHDESALARIAWHIGNRHTPCEVTAGALYIQPDHVLEDMVVGLGAHVHPVMRQFEPEGGAYGGKGPLQHGHHHNGDGDHQHQHQNQHQHAPRKRTIWTPD